MIGWQSNAPSLGAGVKSPHDPYCSVIPLEAVLDETRALLDGTSPVVRWRTRALSEVEAQRFRARGSENPFRVTVNGEEVQGTLDAEKGYLTLSRTWKPGDVVELTMSMVPRHVYADFRVKRQAGWKNPSGMYSLSGGRFLSLISIRASLIRCRQ